MHHIKKLRGKGNAQDSVLIKILIWQQKKRHYSIIFMDAYPNVTPISPENKNFKLNYRYMMHLFLDHQGSEIISR